MALRNLRFEGDELLRKKSRDVVNINQNILSLIDDMYETMYYEDGVGLAAPQVGVLKRVVVVDTGEDKIELINPEIIESSGEQADMEGCLSIPGEEGEVVRPNYIKVKALNKSGEEIEVEATEFFARAICHEIDHLDGILFVDKAKERKVISK